MLYYKICLSWIWTGGKILGTAGTRYGTRYLEPALSWIRFEVGTRQDFKFSLANQC